MSPTPAPNGPFATRPQPKIAPKEPESRQDAAKEAFLDVVFNAKSMGLELVDDFRASDKFFKYKVSVILGWVVLTLLALWVSYPRFEREPSNDLEARVLITKVPALDKQLTAIFIENRSESDWGDTLLKLNNTYTHSVADIKAGAKPVVTLNKFSGPDGASPPDDLKLQKLEIKCVQGRTEIDLNELQNPKK